MSKYGMSLGVWELKVGGSDLELKPIKGDNRKFRRIMMDEKYKKDNASRMDSFDEFFLNLLRRDNPPVDDNEKKEQELFVEYNSTELFKETMIAFRWTTREEMEKTEKEALGDIKKSIGGNSAEEQE